MRGFPIRTLGGILATVGVVSLIACASTEPPRFYTLGSLKVKEAPVTVAQNKAFFLDVGPLHLPDYLDRPQLISRTSGNELHVAEFHRWAGSLKADTVRVLVENLSLLLSDRPVTVIPWRAVASSVMAQSSSVHYKLFLDISRFEGTPGETLRLDVSWALIGKDWADTLLIRKAEYREAVSGKDYAALVDAMSRVLERLSRDVADAVQPHLVEAPKKD